MVKLITAAIVFILSFISGFTLASFWNLGTNFDQSEYQQTVEVEPELADLGFDSTNSSVLKTDEDKKVLGSTESLIEETDEKKSIAPLAAETKPQIIQYSPVEIHEFIERFASSYSVDPNVIRHLAVCESGLNPMAINKNYAGLFQFLPNTWINFRAQMGRDDDINLRLDAKEAIETTAYVLSVNKIDIFSTCVP
jgi:hypothetical protein